jgi:uncharacterized protein YdeI (YjbR/CyaY-like superfamily)
VSRAGPAKPRFFATQADWRAWLAVNHATAQELSVGFWKRGAGRPSITWPESVDEALCFGWIDGVRHRIDDAAYRIRFTPRKPGSVWSRINIRRFGELKAAGLVAPAGQAAFDAGKERTDHYSYENAPASLAADETRRFRKNAKAWAAFQAFPPSYRRPALWWVTSAKRPETRARRLEQLIVASERGERIAAMQPTPKR